MKDLVLDRYLKSTADLHAHVNIGSTQLRN